MKNTRPLTQSQLGVFIECQAQPALTRYNLACQISFGQTFSADQLEQALTKIINKRQTLHTRFIINDEGEPQQWVDLSMPIPIVRRQMTDAQLNAYVKQDFVRPFELLGKTPLCRLEVVETENGVTLLSDIHHTISDGLSFFTLFPKHDLIDALEGKELRGEEKTLQAYALEEEQLLRSPQATQAAHYYQQKFAGLEFTQLSHTSSASIGKAIKVSELIAPAPIIAWCDAHQVKLNILFMAAFSLVLSRLSRQQKTVYASVRHGRYDKALLNTYGMFVKTVPLLNDAQPDMRVMDYLQHTEEEWRSTRNMDNYSFSMFCKELQSVPGIFFSYQGDKIDSEFTYYDGKIKFCQLPRTISDVELNCFVYKHADNFELRLETSDALHSAAYLRQFGKSVAHCVAQLMLLHDKALKEVSLVSADEENSLIALGQGETLDYDKNETLVDLFEKQVKLQPQAPAIVFKDHTYTYQEIDNITTQLALHLQHNYGVGSESVVGIMIDRSEWMFIYPMAVMKAGGAYMPLDFHFPEDRLTYMIDDAGVKLILTEGDLVSTTLPHFKGQTIRREELATLPTYSATLTHRPTAHNSFVILYTSGSTGKPKGCVLEHRNIVNFCYWHVKNFQVTAADRSLAYANFGFDAHMLDMYPLLAGGASVYILPSNMRMDLTTIHQYMEEKQITIAFFTTQIGIQMASLFTFSTLRRMLVGGEKLLPIKKPAYDFYNAYGPTECTIAATCYHLTHDYEDAPIGRPLAGCQLYVMDSSMHLLPQGMAGELCIAGDGVGREYLNNPQMTADKFVTIHGTRMYRTGDLVKWNEKGNIVFIGRIDNQVKLRGLRIELGEIEAVLSRYEGIKSAAVDVKTLNGVQMLCAYYCADHDIDIESLKAHLAESLTDFMVPELYVHMDVMPLTPNGKVNRRALPLPQMELGEIVQPENSAEQQMFDIVAQHLGTTDFGVTTNLITMGLTSIGAIKLSVLLQQQMHLHLSTKNMMKHPEIRQWLKSLQHDTATDNALQVYPQQAYYPLTPNQLGLYIAWEQHPDDLQYNIPYLLKFSHVDAAQLKQSVEQALTAHPYLKVRLTMHKGEIMQERHDADAVEVKLVALDQAPTPAYFQAQIHPFNIIGNPLYDIRVYTYGSDTWLLLNIHHIVFDGTSMNVLLHNIAQAYAGQSVAAETITAYDYALYYQQWQKSTEYVEAEKHFDQLMQQAESVQYPPSTEGMTHQGAQKTRVSMNRSAISHCAQQLGVTENALVMAAVMQTLHRITREHHIMITTISNGRTTDLATDFGMFVQTLPVVSHFDNQCVADVVKSMHQQLLATIDADKYPFTNLVERYGASPQIMVAYQGDVLDAPISLGHAQGEPIPLRLDTVKTPISIDIWNRAGNQLELEIEYDSNVYAEAAMQTFGKAIAALLQRMSTAPANTPIQSLAITTDQEQVQLIQLGQGPQVDMDVTKTFANLFVAQAHKTPERLAVADDHSELSYGEMDAYSNLLAHQFIAQGIQPNDLVCVMLERTKEFPLTVLALHKCGAAYVPLDFEYPNQRLSFMLEDSESKLLITTHSVLDATLAEGEFNIGQAQPFFIDDLLAQPDVKAQALAAAPIDLSKPEGVAYMIYTSGSTGTPKGARLHQAGLHNFIATVIYMEQLTANDRISGHSSFSFDAHVEDMFPILTLGGSFHLIPSAIRKDLGEIRQFLFDHHITGGGYSTAVTCLLLNTFDDLPVRFITAGGEKLPSVYSDHIEILNTYGPTEGTVDTTYYPIKPGIRLDEIPIGRTVANCWNFVVDETGNILPQGIAGELCFAGIQVSMGYWHREEQTAKVFGNCPFVEKDAWGRKVRMYHTGDLCRWNDDGQLEYISRIDTQVKLRGFRIELGEIENAISRYEGIRSTIVVVREMGGMQHLCAYYTADNDVDSNQLREYLSQSLTEYMVPDAYMQMDELPLTPNGKVNRKALPEPVIEQTAVSAYAEPEGEMEVDIAEAYAKVLQTERISANDDFFTLGGTSVSAIKVVAALTLKGYQLSFKNIFECKTPRVLAAYLKGKADGASIAPKPQLVETMPTDSPQQPSAYAQLLNANTLACLNHDASQPLGNVLLTGATGFMGIHFLHELIENETGRIYCLLRDKGNIPAESRLRSLLFYYFNNTYEDLLGQRIFVINGDITQPSTFNHLDIEVDTVINCAANVKHFSAGNDIEKVNVESVRNIIQWCLQTGARLVHISTISVAGQSVDGHPSPNTLLTEHMFDFGQSLDNQYAKSKYEAEKLIFEAISNNNLNAKVLRVATLASRNADGEFQINFRTNGFMGRLRAFAQLGCIAYDMMDTPCEFSPIDEVCRASRLLAQTPRSMVVLHPCNNHTLPLGDVLRCMQVIGINIQPVEREEFNLKVRKMMEDDAHSEVLQPVLAYADNSGHNVKFIDYDSSYTTQVLYRLGYYWPFTSWDYVEKLIKSINGFDFFA